MPIPRARRARTASFAALAVLAAAVVAVPEAAGAAVNVVTIPPTISADCSRDVTADLLAWFKTVPDGSTLRFARNGCYRVDGSLVVRNRNRLVFEGNHATFRAFTDGSELIDAQKIRTRSMWDLQNSSYITLRNTVVIGANPQAGLHDAAYRPKFEAQHGFVVHNVQTAVLDRVEAYDVYGDFVYVGTNSRNVTVRDSKFARNGRQGWTINGTNVLFERNSITDTRRATIDMEPALPTWVARNVTIRNNTVGRGRLYFLASVGAGATIDNIRIENNKLVGRDMKIFVDPPKGTRSRYRIIGNTADKAVSQSGGGAFMFRDIVDLQIRNNVVPVQGGRGISGVSIGNCSGVVITDNQFVRAVAPVRDFGLNVNVRQARNSIGYPLTVAPASTVPGPTPIP